MNRKVSVQRSASGRTAVTVRLSEGDHAASWSVVVWSTITEARRLAERNAVRALNEVREE
jgi:hypothetical protein